MPRFDAQIDIDAPPETIWQVLSDVENWPNWAPTFTTIKLLDGGVAGEGANVWIKQPKLAGGHWVISEWRPGESFTWVSTRSGQRICGVHDIVEQDSGCRFEQSLIFDGWLSGVTAFMGRSLITRYMAMEAEGLKAASEALVR
ncbi:MAG: SRPBCC family protein [Parvibaculum sp.]